MYHVLGVNLHAIRMNPESVRVRVTLLLSVYRLSFRLGAKPLENHD
jgi:hypothetical protein